MPIVTLIVVLLVLGFLLWAAERYLPVEQPFKGIAMFLICVLAAVLILNAFGVGTGLR